MKLVRSGWDILARAFAAFAAALGGATGGGRALLLLMAADLLSGFARALMGKSPNAPDGGVSARAILRGLLRKLMMLLVVALASLLDGYAAAGGALRAATVWFYVCNEGLSALENLVGMGVPVPARLKRLLTGEESE